ncbi:hypothetical protein GCM10011360_13680 [Primorskyibacter flagellatus]|uniref:Uncharacterized protein n=1 Tax=Primorskyibacter flagellatus TaxID=1387277 RepID=A0A917A4K0_9RHOB|nr:DUF6476 family protein [Primorskyibacter flagellatus]GGE26585.1 hypothetical protein GCM10011360_13680 [Primorskyibacter flagellatus]
MDTNTPQNEDPDIPHIRFLRGLVTVLAGVMILGLLVLIVLIVIRFRTPPLPAFPALPAAIALPDGADAQAVTAGPGWYLVVTQDGRALVYASDGKLVSDTALDLP